MAEGHDLHDIVGDADTVQLDARFCVCDADDERAPLKECWGFNLAHDVNGGRHEAVEVAAVHLDYWARVLRCAVPFGSLAVFFGPLLLPVLVGGVHLPLAAVGEDRRFVDDDLGLIFPEFRDP